MTVHLRYGNTTLKQNTKGHHSRNPCSSSGLKLMFSVTSRPQRPEGLLGTGSPGRPPRLSHSSCALKQDPYARRAFIAPIIESTVTTMKTWACVERIQDYSAGLNACKVIASFLYLKQEQDLFFLANWD